MRTVSDTFAAQLKQGYVLAQRIQILLAGAVIYSSDATSPALNIADGSVEVDATASFRRHLSSLRIIDDAGLWTPKTARDIFSSTSGIEIYVAAGMMVNGVPELFDQGYFGIQSSTVIDNKDGVTITLDGYDRARKISRNKFVGTPYTIKSGLNLVDTVVSMWTGRFPGIQFSTVPSAHTTTFQVIDEQADPWEEGRKLLESIGYEGFFNSSGRCVIRPVPDPMNVTTPLAWSYSEGMDSTLLEISRAQDNQEVFSGEIVIGASTYGITPARAEVWDDDPNSPTYYLGPYGKVPHFTQSDKVSYNAQATDMAKGLLMKSKGASEVVSFGIIPNHAHEPGDVVMINRARSGLSNVKVLIDRMSVPLVASGGPVMQMVCRKRTI